MLDNFLTEATEVNESLIKMSSAVEQSEGTDMETASFLLFASALLFTSHLLFKIILAEGLQKMPRKGPDRSQRSGIFAFQNTF